MNFGDFDPMQPDEVLYGTLGTQVADAKAAKKLIARMSSEIFDSLLNILCDIKLSETLEETHELAEEAMERLSVFKGTGR